MVIVALESDNFKVGRPSTKRGKQTAGYPDIVINIDNQKTLYLEVKTYDANQAKSKFRTFYMSPSSNPKVVKTAYHLLSGLKFSSKVKAI